MSPEQQKRYLETTTDEVGTWTLISIDTLLILLIARAIKGWTSDLRLEFVCRLEIYIPHMMIDLEPCFQSMTSYDFY